MVTQRKHIKHGTFVGIHSQIKQLWFERDLEPELLSGEEVPDLPDESDPMRERDAKALLARLLEKCTQRQAAVLAMRHIHGMTLEEVGVALHVTRERARQIEELAKRRVRWKTADDKDIRNFFR